MKMNIEIIYLTNLSEHLKKAEYKDYIVCLTDTGLWYLYDKRPMLTTYTSYHKEKLKLEFDDACLLVDLFNEALFRDDIPEYSVDKRGIVDLPEFGKIKIGKGSNSNSGYTWKKV